MKKLLSVLAVSTALTVPALSNAGPAPCPACPEMPAPKWGGFKLGVQLGYAHGVTNAHGDFVPLDTTTTTTTTTSSSSSSSSSSSPAFGSLSSLENGDSITLGAKGVFGGVHAGYDFQFSRNWIVGAEASFDFLQSSLGKYTVAVVPRVGYGLNDSLFYVGAGWAGSKFNDFENAFRLALGAAQKMGRVMVGVEGDYDWYRHSTRVLSAKLKLSFML